MSKATKAKVAASLAAWRASLTPEAKEEPRLRTQRTQQERWANMSERERRDRLAGVKAWQREQAMAKRAKAKPAPKVGAKAAAPTPKTAKSVGRSTTRKAAS